MHDGLVWLVLLLYSYVWPFVLTFFEPHLERTERPDLALFSPWVCNMNLDLVISIDMGLHIVWDIKSDLVLVFFTVVLGITVYEQLRLGGLSFYRQVNLLNILFSLSEACLDCNMEIMGVLGVFDRGRFRGEGNFCVERCRECSEGGHFELSTLNWDGVGDCNERTVYSLFNLEVDLVSASASCLGKSDGCGVRIFVESRACSDIWGWGSCERKLLEGHCDIFWFKAFERMTQMVD